MQSACWLITLDDFRGLGKMVPHEQARDANLLKAIDEYDDLVQLVNNYPVIFFSHQWQASAEPDPDQLQYDEMLKACEHLCSESSLTRTDQVYIFLDFLSIPQKNPSMRLAAINTLGVFSSLAKYFIVIAPSCHHKDTGFSMNKRTSQRRGWCRLEQWG